MKHRPTLTAKQRAEVFRDNGGICHICERRIWPGEAWHNEHVQARGLGGADNPDNYRPAHIDCHAGKTRQDRAVMAKADRQMKKHTGVKRTRNPLPGSKASRWKRKMDGTVERRR